MKPWIVGFRQLMRHLRSRGWRHVMVLRGNKLRAIGMCGPRQLRPEHHNDNRRSA